MNRISNEKKNEIKEEKKKRFWFVEYKKTNINRKKYPKNK